MGCEVNDNNHGTHSSNRNHYHDQSNKNTDERDGNPDRVKFHREPHSYAPAWSRYRVCRGGDGRWRSSDTVRCEKAVWPSASFVGPFIDAFAFVSSLLANSPAMHPVCIEVDFYAVVDGVSRSPRSTSPFGTPSKRIESSKYRRTQRQYHHHRRQHGLKVSHTS